MNLVPNNTFLFIYQFLLNLNYNNFFNFVKMAFLGEYGFNNFFDFFGFMTNICYILMPLLFNMLIEYGSFEIESISITSVMAMYFNAFTYFFLGFFEQNNGKIILLRDYSNLIGTFLGLVYLTLYFYERYIIEVKILILYSVLVLLGTAIIALLEYFFIVEKSNDAYDKIFKWIGVIPNVMEYLPIGYNIFHLIRDRKSKKFLII